MIFRRSLQVSLTLHPDAGLADLEVESSSMTTAVPCGNQSQYTKRLLISLYHVDIYFVSTLQYKIQNSISQVCWQNVVREMGALKNKNQKSIILTPEIRISAGRLRMHEIDLEFSLKNGLPPPNGGMTCYNWLYAMLAAILCYTCCYASAIGHEIVYNGIRGGYYFEYLEPVEVDGSCLAWIWLYVDILVGAPFTCWGTPLGRRSRWE